MIGNSVFVLGIVGDQGVDLVVMFEEVRNWYFSGCVTTTPPFRGSTEVAFIDIDPS
ncbi:MAG: hypothetical protein KBB36_20495 [Ferrovibrio sp.]|nr:hypothetical protein [Ferrovibrio sp.]